MLASMTTGFKVMNATTSCPDSFTICKIGVGFTNGTMKPFKLELQKGRLMHGAKRKQKKRKGKVRKNILLNKFD
jgi:hypothetical protein